MPSPDSVTRWCRAAAPVALLMAAAPCRAQYSGGSADGYSGSGQRYVVPGGGVLPVSPFAASPSGGDGYARGGFLFAPVNGVALPAAPFLAGKSGGDGYSAAGTGFFPLSGGLPPAPVFTASARGGDGYAFSGLVHQPVNGAVPVLAVFKGGSGDGGDVRGLDGQPMGPEAVLFSVYKGGAGDGYSVSGSGYAPVGGAPPPAVLYTAGGSGGDGFDTGGLRHQSLQPGDAPAELYTGSSTGGDGYDRAGLAYQSMNGEAPPVFVYTGSAGDGYSGNGIHHAALEVPAALPAALYAGSAGDGYDTRSLPFVQYLGGGESASGIHFAGWRYSRFSTEELEEGLGEPSIDADGDGLPNLLEFALGSDPRQADALAFGPQFRLSNLTDFGLPALPDQHLTALVRRNPLALDAGLQIEVTSDPAAEWSVTETVMVESTPGSFLVRDQLGVQTAPVRSMRLRATLNP